MYHTIEKMKEKMEFLDENKKKTSSNGYALMDKSGHCIIITWGEGNRDSMSEYLNSDSDPLGLKYEVNMLPSSKG